mmetsp:Transcript_3970/g.11278  ORF Transcript_3970/g.11278 Transcript_3970/m.11278 type:complete len:273 (-) Transcript_3970:1670-2488(-)
MTERTDLHAFAVGTPADDGGALSPVSSAKADGARARSSNLFPLAAVDINKNRDDDPTVEEECCDDYHNDDDADDGDDDDDVDGDDEPSFVTVTDQFGKERTVSAYEARRIKRIRRNKEKLASLGLDGSFRDRLLLTADSAEVEQQKKERRKQRERHEKQRKELAATRDDRLSSLRERKKQVSYADSGEAYGDLSDLSISVPRLASVGGRKSVRGRKSVGGHKSINEPIAGAGCKSAKKVSHTDTNVDESIAGAARKSAKKKEEPSVHSLLYC